MTLSRCVPISGGRYAFSGARTHPIFRFNSRRNPSVADPRTFRSGRNLFAWIGLVPKQHSSGGKDRLGSISKQGDRYLRSLLVVGALAVIRYAKIHGTKYRPWLTALLARRPTEVAASALANKIARMAWAMMAKGERYMVRPCVARRFDELAVSGLASIYPAFDWSAVLRAIMDISARASSLSADLNWAIRVTSVRTRREDRTSISSHPLADPGG